MSADAAISVRNLGKLYKIGQTLPSYKTRQRELINRVLRRTVPEDGVAAPARSIWALRDVSFDVAEGDVVGIIGRNGAGKVDAAQDPLPHHRADGGPATIHGRVGSLLEVGTGFHPELTGRENIYLNGADPRDEEGRDPTEVRRDRRLLPRSRRSSTLR